MEPTSLSALAARLASAKTDAPAAVVIAEDGFALAETIAHLRNLGFPQIAVVAADEAILPGAGTRDADVISAFVPDLPAMPDVLNALVAKLANRWLHVCYNAEFLFFPFCEHRSMIDAVAFSAEERRNSVFGYTIDLYQDEFELASDPLRATPAYFDSTGYYGVTPVQAAGEAPVVEVFGGLRWRFSEHVHSLRQNIDRICMFRCAADLRFDADMKVNKPDYQSISCQWHHSMTMAVASFRAAKALCLNPSSRDAIKTLKWPMSERFEWSSGQLLRAGFIEPGQWF